MVHEMHPTPAVTRSGRVGFRVYESGRNGSGQGQKYLALKFGIIKPIPLKIPSTFTPTILDESHFIS
jgi:hypothetical protein